MSELPVNPSHPKVAKRNEVLQGIGLLMLLHLLFVFGCLALADSGLVDTGRSYGLFGVALLVGFFQFSYLIPLGLILYFLKREAMLKGVIMCAAATLLLNGTCALAYR